MKIEVSNSIIMALAIGASLVTLVYQLDGSVKLGVVLVTAGALGLGVLLRLLMSSIESSRFGFWLLYFAALGCLVAGYLARGAPWVWGSLYAASLSLMLAAQLPLRSRD